ARAGLREAYWARLMMIIMMVVMVMMLDHDNLVMMLVVTVMMLDHDHLVMTIPITVMITVADVDRNAALLRNHHRLVACRRPGQDRGTQDCERARDKSQLVHVMFLQ